MLTFIFLVLLAGLPILAYLLASKTKNKGIVLKREEILSMIWDMEEEIMGKEIG